MRCQARMKPRSSSGASSLARSFLVYTVLLARKSGSLFESPASSVLSSTIEWT